MTGKLWAYRLLQLLEISLLVEAMRRQEFVRGAEKISAPPFEPPQHVMSGRTLGDARTQRTTHNLRMRGLLAAALREGGG